MPHPRAQINPLWGERLKIICEENKISQSELASSIFISQQTISKIVNGKASLTLPTAQRIIDLFPQRGYSLDWLLGNSNYKTMFDMVRAIGAKEERNFDLLFSGLSSLAEYKGFTILPPWSVVPGAPKAEYAIQKDGKEVRLGIKEMELLEHLLADLAAVQLDALFKASTLSCENDKSQEQIVMTGEEIKEAFGNG